MWERVTEIPGFHCRIHAPDADYATSRDVHRSPLHDELAMAGARLAAAIINITIGGSIFALPGTLYQALGPAAPLAYILGAALFAPIVRASRQRAAAATQR
jgi:hypothetical protein